MQYNPYYHPLIVFTANLYILFAITVAGVVSCGGRIFLFRSFEISTQQAPGVSLTSDIGYKST